MLHAQSDIHVDAPPDEVFAFLDDPSNHVKITPSLTSLSGVEGVLDDGKRAEFTYQLAGIELSGVVRDIVREPGRKLVQRFSGSISGTVKYLIDPEDEGARVSYEAAYELPSFVLESLAEPLGRTYNRREAETTLRNLKAHVER